MSKQIEAILKDNPNFSILSKSRLYKVLKAKNNSITLKDVTAYLEDKPLQQIFHKPVNPVPFKITAEPKSFQIDIIDMYKYRKYNKGFKKFLLIVDVMSRKAWVYPMKTGKMEQVMTNYKDFVEKIKEINSVTGDDFFKNKQFLDYNKEKEIETFTDIAKENHISYGNKLGIVDRLTRTLKNLIKRKMTSEDKPNWINHIQDLVELYNTAPHRGLNDTTPNERWEDVSAQVDRHFKDVKFNDEQYKKLKVKVDDDVRVYEGKDIFEKEKANFTKDPYIVKEKTGFRFKVVDENNKPFKRPLKAHELLKITKTIKKVIKTTKLKRVDEDNKINRKLQKEGIDIKNITRKPKTRGTRR